MSAFFMTNTLNWIFIVLVDRSNSKYVATLEHIFLIPSQPSLIPYFWVLSENQQIPIS